MNLSFNINASQGLSHVPCDVRQLADDLQKLPSVLVPVRIPPKKEIIRTRILRAGEFDEKINGTAILAAFDPAEMFPADIQLLRQLLLGHAIDVPKFLQSLSKCFLVEIHVSSFPPAAVKAEDTLPPDEPAFQCLIQGALKKGYRCRFPKSGICGICILSP